MNVVGVTFKKAGKIYYFDAKDKEVSVKDNVIVDTKRGLECGKIVQVNQKIEDKSILDNLKAVKRIATEEDMKKYNENLKDAKEAKKTCIKKVNEHGLEMKILTAQYTFDRNKLIFTFTADGRIDFRELVRDLAGIFRRRIELRQVGVRDETKTLSGIGVCGRELCCSSFKREFNGISIKMAKEQNLSLNPAKISGVCNRLMCCLKYENKLYKELNKKLPKTGTKVIVNKKEGMIISLDTLKEEVKVKFNNEDGYNIKKYHIDEIEMKKRGK